MVTLYEAIKIAKREGGWREYMDCSPHPTYHEVLDGVYLVQDETASDCWLEVRQLEN